MSPEGTAGGRPSEALARPHVALVGLRASGKTTVGRCLAERLARPFVDLDEALVELAGAEDGGAAASGAVASSAGALLAALGEEPFRDLEARALERVLAGERGVVVATGGGAILRAGNRERLRARARSIWLDGDSDLLRARMAADSTERPPLRGDDALAEVAVLARERRPLYAEAADLRIDAGAADARSLAREIAAWLERVDTGVG